MEYIQYTEGVDLFFIIQLRDLQLIYFQYLGCSAVRSIPRTTTVVTSQAYRNCTYNKTIKKTHHQDSNLSNKVNKRT